MLGKCKTCQFDVGELIETRVPSAAWDGLAEIVSHDINTNSSNPAYHVIKVQVLNGGTSHGKLADYYANMLRKLKCP